jgi:hypothetical protein
MMPTALAQTAPTSTLFPPPDAPFATIGATSWLRLLNEKMLG